MQSFLPCFALALMVAAMLTTSSSALSIEKRHNTPKFIKKDFSCDGKDTHCVFMDKNAYADGPDLSGPNVKCRSTSQKGKRGLKVCQYPDTSLARIQCKGKLNSFIDIQFGQISSFTQQGKAVGEWSTPNNGIVTHTPGADLHVKCLP